MPKQCNSLEKNIAECESTLYECAAAVEQDTALRYEMEDWNVTLYDGLDDE